MTRSGVLLTVALALSSPGHVVQADTVTHVLSGHETLETLAQLYYGDASWADGLRRYNALEAADPVPGTTVVVPLPSLHRVVAGDSWEALAAHYWNDAGLGIALSELSDAPDAELVPDREIRIPVLLSHGLRPGESLAALSRRLYGGPDRAGALAALNRIQDPRRLAIGQVVRIPILGPSQVGAAPVEEPPSQPALPEVPPAPATAGSAELERFQADLRHADAAYREGDFQRAREMLEELRPKVLAEGSHREQCRLLYQLTQVYGAFDAAEQLCTSYAALRALDPAFEWDPDFTSPKIIRLAAGCDGL